MPTRIAHDMAVEAKRHCFDQRGSTAASCTIDGLSRRAVHRHRIVTIHVNTLYAVACRAIGDPAHRSAGAQRSVFRIEVVLADEYHGQFPHRGQIQRLMKGTYIVDAPSPKFATVTRFSPLNWMASARPHAMGMYRAHNARGHPCSRLLDACDVHRTALALARASRLARQFSSPEKFWRDTLGAACRAHPDRW